MKVLIFNDEDGHTGAYDISDPMKFRNIIKQLIKSSYRKPKFDDVEFDSWSENQIFDFLETELELFFDRSGGGIAYMVEVEEEFKQVYGY